MSDLPVKTSFWRNIISSSTATSVDFLTMVFLTEVVNIYYLISVAIGTIAGAITSFSLGRYWTFERADKPWIPQAIKYAISSGIIMLFNVVGVYLLTEYLAISYMYSKIIVSIFVGVFVSFGLFRYFVYK